MISKTWSIFSTATLLVGIVQVFALSDQEIKAKHGLNDEDFKAYKASFGVFDHNNSGSISESELDKTFDGLGVKLSDNQRKSINEADENGDKHLSLDEYITLAMKDSSLDLRFVNVFASLDKDKNGTVSIDEFYDWLRLKGRSYVTKEDVAKVDHDKNGKIGYFEMLAGLEKFPLK